MGQNNRKVRFFQCLLQFPIPLLIGRNQPPWDENWVLDDKFFRQMEAWETEHPESTFAKVIEKVNSAVTMCQPFLGHIPDSPFPACSLIQSLAYLLQLGMVWAVLILAINFILQICMQTITSAKKDVYNFTMQVSSWLSAIEASLRVGKKKKFASKAKKNLTVIRWVPAFLIGQALMKAIGI